MMLTDPSQMPLVAAFRFLIVRIHRGHSFYSSLDGVEPFVDCMASSHKMFVEQPFELNFLEHGALFQVQETGARYRLLIAMVVLSRDSILSVGLAFKPCA
jgi:hypothetical protein